jgi:hypothetical protein
LTAVGVRFAAVIIILSEERMKEINAAYDELRRLGA